MADVYTRIGYIKGDTGATGAQGAKGDTGDAATIEVGTVTTVPYGQTANVVNSGTSGAAVFDFTIPQGRPGEQTTDMQNLTLGSITTSSASFPVPAVGETGKVLWGKVVKWFSDMSALVATKLNAANVVNNLTTTSSGYALDARQGKALNDVITKSGSGTCTAIKSGVVFGSLNTVQRYGNLAQVTVVFQTPSESAAGVQLIRLPYTARFNNLIVAKADDGNVYVLGVNANSNALQVMYNPAVPATVFRMGFLYVITD